MLGSNPTRGTVAVAQLVEQWIVVPPVAGSILVGHLWVDCIAAITAVCKTVDFGLRWFESNPTHLLFIYNHMHPW